MKARINNNRISGKDFIVTLNNFLPENPKFVLQEIRARNHYDKDRKKTDAIEAYMHTVIELNTLATLDIRVNTTVPVITAEELAEADERVFVEIPLEETLVKPYRLEYGVATVSIVSPYITLATDSEESEEN